MVCRQGTLVIHQPGWCRTCQLGRDIPWTEGFKCLKMGGHMDPLGPHKRSVSIPSWEHMMGTWGSTRRICWWFGTSILFSIIFSYIGNNHPNWLIFFRGVETTNQKGFVGSILETTPAELLECCEERSGDLQSKLNRQWRAQGCLSCECCCHRLGLTHIHIYIYLFIYLQLH